MRTQSFSAGGVGLEYALCFFEVFLCVDEIGIELDGAEEVFVGGGNVAHACFDGAAAVVNLGVVWGAGDCRVEEFKGLRELIALGGKAAEGVVGLWRFGMIFDEFCKDGLGLGALPLMIVDKRDACAYRDEIWVGGKGFFVCVLGFCDSAKDIQCVTQVPPRFGI